MPSLVKSFRTETIIYGLGASMQMLLGFILLPILTKNFSSSDYGIIDINSTVIQIYIIFFNMGLVTAVSFYYYHHKNPLTQKTTISTAFFALLFTNLIAGLILLVFYKKFGSFLFKNPDYAYLFIITVFTAIVSNLFSYLLHILRISRQAKRYVKFVVIKLLLDLLLIYFAVFKLNLKLQGYFIALPIAYIIMVPFIIYKVKNVLSFDFSWKTLKSLLKYGLPLIPSGLSLWILNLSDRFFLLKYKTLTDVALYGVAVRSTVLISLLVMSINLAWAPFAFSIKTKPDAQKVYSRIFEMYILAASFFMLVTSLFAQYLIPFITTKEYYASYIFTPILCLGVILLGSYHMFTLGINLVKKIYFVAITASLAAIINLILNFLLIPKYGITGASITTLFSYFLAAISIYYFSQKYYPINYRILKSAITIFVTICFVIIGVYILPEFEQLFNILIKVILVILFFPLLHITGIVNLNKLRNKI